MDVLSFIEIIVKRKLQSHLSDDDGKKFYSKLYELILSELSLSQHFSSGQINKLNILSSSYTIYASVRSLRPTECAPADVVQNFLFQVSAELITSSGILTENDLDGSEARNRFAEALFDAVEDLNAFPKDRQCIVQLQNLVTHHWHHQLVFVPMPSHRLTPISIPSPVLHRIKNEPEAVEDEDLSTSWIDSELDLKNIHIPVANARHSISCDNSVLVEQPPLASVSMITSETLPHSSQFLYDDVRCNASSVDFKITLNETDYYSVKRPVDASEYVHTKVESSHKVEKSTVKVKLKTRRDESERCFTARTSSVSAELMPVVKLMDIFSPGFHESVKSSTRRAVLKSALSNGLVKRLLPKQARVVSKKSKSLNTKIHRNNVRKDSVDFVPDRTIAVNVNSASEVMLTGKSSTRRSALNAASSKGRVKRLLPKQPRVVLKKSKSLGTKIHRNDVMKNSADFIPDRTIAVNVHSASEEVTSTDEARMEATLSTSLLLPQRTTSGNISVVEYACSLCDKTFISDKALHLHALFSHNVDYYVKPSTKEACYCCKKCGVLIRVDLFRLGDDKTCACKIRSTESNASTTVEKKTATICGKSPDGKTENKEPNNRRKPPDRVSENKAPRILTESSNEKHKKIVRNSPGGKNSPRVAVASIPPNIVQFC